MALQLPSYWHACALALARLCHHIGTVVPSHWHTFKTTKITYYLKWS